MKTHSVLVVIDVQNDFVSGSLGTSEAQVIVPKVAEKIRNWKGDIIYTRDTHSGNYLETREGKNLPIIHCIEGTEGWQIVPDVLIENAVIVNKNTFGSLELPEIISKFDNVSKIEVVGLVLNICVVSNLLILKSKFPELNIILDSNCTAATSKEDFDAAIRVLKSNQIDIV